MLGVGRQALETVGDELPQGADILILGGQNAHGLGLGLPVAGAVPQGGLMQASGVAELAQQFLPGIQGHADARLDGGLVKVGVGDGGKQIEGDQVVDRSLHRLALGPQGGGNRGQALRHIDQQILHSGYVGLLSAYAHPGAALAAGGLLALIAKHIVFHGCSSLGMGCLSFWP